MKQQQVNVIVDGININATHIAGFENKEKAISDMLKQGYVPEKDGKADVQWAESAYEKAIAKVQSANNKVEKAEAREGKETAKETAAAGKAEESINTTLKPKQ